jgi:hypothetical protein
MEVEKRLAKGRKEIKERNSVRYRVRVDVRNVNM